MEEVEVEVAMVLRVMKSHGLQEAVEIERDLLYSQKVEKWKGLYHKQWQHIEGIGMKVVMVVEAEGEVEVEAAVY